MEFRVLLVRGQHADFSTAAHWETHPKMATEIYFIPILMRLQTARDLHTNFQLCCSEGKVEAGYVHLEMHWMTYSITYAEVSCMMDRHS